jgi:uncharacterized protein
MQWKRGYRSNDVEVRRAGAGGGGGMGGGLFGIILSLIGSKFGWVGILLAIGAFYLYSNFTGGGMSSNPQVATQESRQYEEQAKEDPRVQFVSFVLDDVQETWSKIFAKEGQSYERAKMVIFSGATSTACGTGQTATGPFYCPSDHKVYLDVSFFQTLDQRLGAKGDFAQAYVVAHEVGHHVQNITGGMERGASIAIELQADCYAGVWAKSTGERNLLEAGDAEEAINAAAAVGDDRLQEMSQGTVQPEKWTHGSSKQRASWFNRGFESGDPRACDTFKDATAARRE